MDINIINKGKNYSYTHGLLSRDQTILMVLFSVLFLLYFIFREFLFYVAPFMPSTGINMVDLELIGTFSVFGLEIVIPFMLYLIKAPLSGVYFIITVLMLWGGTLLSILYPMYYMSIPWVIGSLIYVALTVLSLITLIYELRIKSLPLIPLILLQLASLILYIANVLTEYFALPLGDLSPYFVYPMLYLAGIGSIALLIYSTYALIIEGKVNARLILGYVAAAVLSVSMAYPLYTLTMYNGFMSHIMSMVFAMGLGILSPPSSMPLIAVFMGIYTYSIIALVISGIMNKIPMYYLVAVASLIYVTTAFIEHAIIVIFASVLTITNLIIYLNIINKPREVGDGHAGVS
ncbi:hypothetical protein [Vulcanisaeta souniana]|uniref:Cytochrome b558/566 subunit B n=1 Tax=Vulcanisaeta souniana JCM 11219 TaxID=1293586 RepID=A0A830E2Z8_9CREN|nr:hypothetical protein [Vulcanisaeta souniana]BDR92824.1 hypothetical protein Vsou_19170 [Vulcanisaeta souniana JCM 11219]GGI81844.1 hypothetical protein GCM10007112_18230 [Vulcanisaeta souniana JCM 11219]